MIKLTIIIPVFNEIKTVEKLINKILKLNIKKQLIIVDDGSSDGTEFILKKLRIEMEKCFHLVQTYKPAASKSKSGEIYLFGEKPL